MKILYRLSYTILLLLFLSSSLAAQDFSEIEQGKNGVPDDSWPSIYFRSFDRVISALGILPLRDKQLRGQRKEVRIWTGLSIGAPKSLYILSIDGQKVEGRLVLYWNANSRDTEPEGESFHDLMIYNLTGRCENFTSNGIMGYCIALFENSPDWNEIYHKASLADLWDLPDESELPSDSFIIDGWGIVVELLDKDQYRTYHYSNPDKRDWPEAAKALEIFSIISSARLHLRSSDVTRRYKGITSGEYRSAFKECESNEVWAFRSSSYFDSLAARADIEIPEPGKYGYLVEVIGTPTPEWIARKWDSDFIREIQTSTLISVEPASSPDCK